jgi:hypothetical protein
LFGGDPGAAEICVAVLPQGGGMTTLTRAEIGALGERLAADHLIGLGLRIVSRNWRCRYGELDLIAVDRPPTRWYSSRSRLAPAMASAGSRRR